MACFRIFIIPCHDVSKELGRNLLVSFRYMDIYFSSKDLHVIQIWLNIREKLFGNNLFFDFVKRVQNVSYNFHCLCPKWFKLYVSIIIDWASSTKYLFKYFVIPCVKGYRLDQLTFDFYFLTIRIKPSMTISPPPPPPPMI